MTVYSFCGIVGKSGWVAMSHSDHLDHMTEGNYSPLVDGVVVCACLGWKEGEEGTSSRPFRPLIANPLEMSI